MKIDCCKTNLDVVVCGKECIVPCVRSDFAISVCSTAAAVHYVSGVLQVNQSEQDLCETLSK